MTRIDLLSLDVLGGTSADSAFVAADVRRYLRSDRPTAMGRRGKTRLGEHRMTDRKLPLDTVIVGDSVDALASLPEKSVDVVFADPPYNLQLAGELLWPNNTRRGGGRLGQIQRLRSL